VQEWRDKSPWRDESQNRGLVRDESRPALMATPAPRRVRNLATPPRQEANVSDASNAAAAAPQRRGTVRGIALSRTTLRQAVLLNEILGVPKALQPPPRSTIS
jgi:ribosomal protein S14